MPGASVSSILKRDYEERFDEKNNPDPYMCGFEEEHIDPETGEWTITKCWYKYRNQCGRTAHIREAHEKIRFKCPI